VETPYRVRGAFLVTGAEALPTLPHRTWFQQNLSSVYGRRLGTAALAAVPELLRQPFSMNFSSARFATAASKQPPWGGVITPKMSRQKQHTEVRSCSFGVCVWPIRWHGWHCTMPFEAVY